MRDEYDGHWDEARPIKGGLLQIGHFRSFQLTMVDRITGRLGASRCSESFPATPSVLARSLRSLRQRIPLNLLPQRPSPTPRPLRRPFLRPARFFVASRPSLLFPVGSLHHLLRLTKETNPLSKPRSDLCIWTDPHSSAYRTGAGQIVSIYSSPSLPPSFQALSSNPYQPPPSPEPLRYEKMGSPDSLRSVSSSGAPISSYSAPAQGDYWEGIQRRWS